MDFKSDVLEQLKINLNEEQLNQFELYYEKLIAFNTHTNLTTITEKKDVYYKHFFDSLTISYYIDNKSAKLCDMGSGAGFPSIPLKIVYPDLKITIIDSNNKRIRFLKELVALLNLKNVELIHNRIEVYALKNLKKFDYVTARALGNLTLITEMAVPMLKIGGTFIAMKGSQGEKELEEASNAINITGGKVISERYLQLPLEYGERSIYTIKKVKHVDGYPRQYQQMLKKPL